jgi:hypothetical protein
MDGKLTYGASTILSVLSLVLLIANIALINSNRNLQDSANQRQAEISKGSSFANLNQGLVQALAEAAVNNNDAGIKDLLASQGITINPKAVAKPTAAPAAPAQKPAAKK